jgi:FkbM family methyltransferase
MRAKQLIPQPVRAAVKRGLQSRSLQMGQAGQDLWVIGEVFNEKRGGYFVFVGAHDGVELSNTYLLEKKYGWEGICIEANPDTFKQLQQNRSVACTNACIDSRPRTVRFSRDWMHSGIVSTGGELLLQTRTLDDVLDAHAAPDEIDYLSVDVEGAEDGVFAGLDLKRRHVVCMTVERPSAQLREKLARSGYVVVRDIPGLDAFFVHESHSERYLQNVFGYYEKRQLAVRWR